MEQFEKKLVGMAGAFTPYAIAFFAIAVALIVCGIWLNQREQPASFDAMSEGYASMDVVYVMGPFVEEMDGERTSKEFFIAEASDQMWYVVSTYPNTGLPIYGEDITEADMADLTAQTVSGKSKPIPEEVAWYLADFFSGTDLGITSTNYADYFGTQYLDTTATAFRSGGILYFLAGMSALFGLIFLLIGNKQRKQVKKQISVWEANGQLRILCDDFASDDSLFEAKLKLAASHHYLLDFAAETGGVRMIPLSEIDRVFLCNMIAGQPTTTNYIALEDGEKRYCVAKCPRKTKQFIRVLDWLKTDTEKETTLS